LGKHACGKPQFNASGKGPEVGTSTEGEGFARHLRAVMAAGNAFVSVPAWPGYDAKDEQAPALPLDNIGQEPGPANL
jgi:hypothetical protein